MVSTAYMKCVFMIALVYLVNSRGIIQNVVTTDCSINPAGGFRCVQYFLQDMDCDPQNLRTRFPHLFELSGGIAWPGEGVISSQGEHFLSWKSRKDGSVNFLEGFLVDMMGLDMSNLGLWQCFVIDISNRTSTETPALTNATFTVRWESAGDYDITITSLPLPPSDVSAESITSLHEETDEYHPQTNVSFKIRLEESSVYVQLTFTPALDNISQFYLSVYNTSSNERLESLSRMVYPEFVLSGLEEGNYTIELIPIDKHQDDLQACTCYTSVGSTRQSCVPCHSYSTNFVVTRTVTPGDGSESKGMTEILAPVLGAVLAIIGLVAFLLWKFCRLKYIQSPRDLLKYVLGDCPLCKEKKKMIIVYIQESTFLERVVTAFIDLLTSQLYIDVIKGQHNDVIKTSDDVICTLENVDIICFVHSERSCSLFKQMKCESSRPKTHDDFCFLEALDRLSARSELDAKTLSVYVSCRNITQVIEEVSGPKFPITSSIDAFLKCAQAKFNVKRKHSPRKKQKENELKLDKAIEAYRTYLIDQKKAETLDNADVQIAITGSDSIVNDVPAHSGFGCSETEEYNTNVHCSDCLRGKWNGAMQRSVPYHDDFYPPDTESDDVSARYSVLERAAMEINSRYEHWTQHVDLNEDCWTVGGQSV